MMTPRRYAIRLLVFFWTLLLAMIIYGWRLPAEHRLNVEVPLSRPVPEVWQVLVDFKNYPHWWGAATAVKDYQRLPDGREVFKMQDEEGGWLSYEVRTREEEKFLSIYLVDQGLPYVGSWTFELMATGDKEARLQIIENGLIRVAFLRAAFRIFRDPDARLNTFARNLRTHINSMDRKN